MQFVQLLLYNFAIFFSLIFNYKYALSKKINLQINTQIFPIFNFHTCFDRRYFRSH